jgi:hypothetical protein
MYEKKGGYLSLFLFLSKESVFEIFILFSKVEITFDKRKSNHEKIKLFLRRFPKE